jgi:hypothetical protein
MQFDQVLEAYRQASKYWSSTFNRFAEGEVGPQVFPAFGRVCSLVLAAAVRLRGRKRAMVG